jgi:hypothetical protein
VNYIDHLPANLVAAEYGQFGRRRFVGVVSPHLSADFTSLLAVELAASQGPFQVAEDLQKMNLVAGLSHRLGEHGGFDARVFDGYESVHPLADGWRDRVDLHQIAPLVVHAIKFGGHYVPAATAAIDRYV